MNMVNMKGAAMRQITITADKKYLLIPVGNVKGWTIPAESIQYLSIYQNGSLVEEYEVCLDASPRCWSCLYLERYAGETLELRLEGGDESLIELLEVSDTLKDADTLYREPMRPLAHITPMHGFMNDPNGLFYLNGKYHCFAQLNPYGLGVGNTHWMHMVSWMAHFTSSGRCSFAAMHSFSTMSVIWLTSISRMDLSIPFRKKLSLVTSVMRQQQRGNILGFDACALQLFCIVLNMLEGKGAELGLLRLCGSSLTGVATVGG